MSKILVTGGAGYIGTNVVNDLAKKGENIVVIDNFSNSKSKYIEKLKEIYPDKIETLSWDFGDKAKLNRLFKDHDITTVIHLAGKKYVQESNDNPELYKLENVEKTKALIETMEKNDVKKIVFASTALVYGNADPCPIDEERRLKPLSYYAKTKLMAEELVKKFASKNGNCAVILRLSNPMGADEQLLLGDDNLANAKPLLPHLLEAVNNGDKVFVNGNDYNTKDGTPVRDFVHVSDVAQAFSLAAEKNCEGCEVFNVGFGEEGVSVLDILREVENVTGCKVECAIGGRREGDVASFVSDNKKAKNLLGLKFTKNLRDMVSSQYKFSKHINEDLD